MTPPDASAGALTLFRAALQRRPAAIGDEEQLKLYRAAADAWRSEGQFFYAGVALSHAVHAAWGDGGAVRACATGAAESFAAAVANPASDLERLAAFSQSLLAVGRLDYLADRGRAAVREAVRAVEQDLAQTLLTEYRNDDNATNYLVRGVVVSTDFKGSWRADFPDYEVAHGTISYSGDAYFTPVPSAFTLLVRLADYVGALEVAELVPEAFTTPGLRGWRAAARAFVSPETAAEAFAEAATHFAEDTDPESPEELRRRGGSWSGINVQLWAKYFAARAAVARLPAERERTQELLDDAVAALSGTESGFVSAQVTWFRLLLSALRAVVRTDGERDLDSVREDLIREARIFDGGVDQQLIFQFVELASRAFSELASDPAQALATGTLAHALDVLRRIPLLGEDVADAIAPLVGASGVGRVLGPPPTWIYRTLESITDEAHLRHIILRLAQAAPALYAQIRHGPIEYGSDVIVVIEKGGRRVLQMYQAKCGDLTKARWREAQDELEEMFLVAPPALQLGDVDDRVGVLVCNGHANPYVEPLMNAWFGEQKRTFGRQFEFMHLDRLVPWITERRLESELRAALEELKITPQRPYERQVEREAVSAPAGAPEA